MKNILLLSLLAIAFFAMSACDHGLGSDGNSHHNGNTQNNSSALNIRSASLDPVTGCFLEEVHQHNGVYYGEHYNNDGHGHHGLRADDVCNVTTCSATAIHDHNGTHYAGHNNGCNGHNGHGNHGNGHH